MINGHIAVEARVDKQNYGIGKFALNTKYLVPGDTITIDNIVLECTDVMSEKRFFGLIKVHIGARFRCINKDR